MRAGFRPETSRAYFRDLYCFQSRSSAACLTRRPCSVCHYLSRSISCPVCQGRPQAVSLAGRKPAGSWRALWGGLRLYVTRIVGMKFSRNSGGGFPSLHCPPEKRPSEYPHAENFSKYFFMSRRIRSRRLMTSRWVTPIRWAHSLVERQSKNSAVMSCRSLSSNEMRAAGNSLDSSFHSRPYSRARR